MATPVTMPQMGESVVEGTVSRWLKQAGETVQRMEPLLEISTDKIDTEIPAPSDGVLLAILVEEGQTVQAGTVLAYIGEPGEALPEGVAPAATGRDGQGSQEQEQPQPEPVQAASTSAIPAPARGKPATPRPGGRGFISPVVARIAAEHNVDVSQVPGTGKGGRVTKKDILAFIQRRQQAPVPPPVPAPAPPPPGAPMPPPPPPEAAPAPPGQGALSPDEVLQPLTTMRRLIAEHMVQSKRTSPHVTTVFEVDMTRVVQHREAHKAAFAQAGVNLTFTAYFVAATAAALRRVPEVNSRFTPEGLVLNRRIHIGVAVAVENGLLVPVIRDADEKNLQGLARAVNDLAQRARQGQLRPDELQGGTFTITNHGVSGSLFATPVINQPQAGILGVGAIVKRPVVRSAGPSLLPSADDAIVIRPICYLSFTFDHRVLDGAQADAFVAAVKEFLESYG